MFWATFFLGIKICGKDDDVWPMLIKTLLLPLLLLVLFPVPLKMLPTTAPAAAAADTTPPVLNPPPLPALPDSPDRVDLRTGAANVESVDGYLNGF